MNKQYRIGIDIGGTKVNAGLLHEDGRIIDNQVFSSAGAQQTEQFVDSIASVIEDLLARRGLSLSQISHIGVGIPGTANSLSGMVEYSCNLFGTDIPLGEYFKKRLGRSVMITQDSWAAAWGEHRFGAGRGHENMLCVTIGTGIGCGVILNGKVFVGAMHAAGELGHIPIEPNGRLCGCGKRGCLEAYASGSAIWTQAMERFPEKLTGKPQRTETVFDMVYQGDTQARTLIDECVDKLAYGLSMMLNILSTDTVIISGGLSTHKELLIDPLRKIILQYGYPSWTRQNSIQILQAELGCDAPMVGAAFLGFEHM